jgi:hypothetical protein
MMKEGVRAIYVPVGTIKDLVDMTLVLPESGVYVDVMSSKLPQLPPFPKVVGAVPVKGRPGQARITLFPYGRMMVSQGLVIFERKARGVWHADES